MSIRLPINSPVLSGGLSEQTDHLRFPNQVASAVNVTFDVADGMSKRAGTDFDRKFTETPAANLRAIPFVYAPDEKYVIVFGRNGSGPLIRIFRDGGGEASVSISGAATTYLGLNTATADQMVFRQVRDTVLCVNKTVATAVIASDSYTIERARKDYDALVSYTTTVGNKLKTNEDDERATAGFYQYAPGTYTYGLMNFGTLTGSWTIHNGYWDDNTYGNPVGFVVAFRRVNLAGFTGATYTAASRTITSVGAFASYTFRSGDMIYITAGTGFTANRWYKIASRTSANAIVLDSVQPSGATLPGADNADTAANVTAATYSETNRCRIGLEVEVNVDTKALVEAGTIGSMDDVAYEIQRAMRDAGAYNATCAWIPSGSGGAFQITSPWRGNNSIVYAPIAPRLTVAANGDLSATGFPFDGTGSFQVFGGTGGAAADASDTDTPESRWTRIAPPGQSGAALDATTMPVRITRDAANTFSVAAVTWDQRGSGDSTSNAAPKLFTAGAKIADVALHRNRLMLLGGPYIAASVIADHEAFFAEDANNGTDADPLNLTIPDAAHGLHWNLWRDVLLMFTTGGEFELIGGEVLSPTTAYLKRTTGQVASSVRSAVGTTTAYFAVENGDYASIYEYFFDELQGGSDAGEITRNVQRLIPAALREILASPNHQTVIVLPTDTQLVYVYRYHIDGQNRKVQSAWSTIDWTAGYNGDYSFRVVDAMILGNNCWFLVENAVEVAVASGAAGRVTFPGHGLSDGNQVTLDSSTTDPSVNGTFYIDVIDANTFDLYTDAGLTTPFAVTTGGTARLCIGDYIFEKLPLGRPTTATGYPYSVALDRKLSLTGSHSLGTTTWTLPNSPSVGSGSAQFRALGSTLNKIVLGPAFGANAGTVLDITGYSGNTVTVAGDYSAGAATLGRFFEASARLTRPFYRDERGEPDIASPLCYETVFASYLRTTSFSVVASETNRSDRTRTKSNGSTPSNGVFDTGLNGDASNVALSIKDSTAGPFTVTGIRYECEHSPVGNTVGGNSGR